MLGHIFFVNRFGEHGGLLGNPESSDAICLKKMKCLYGVRIGNARSTYVRR